MGAVDDRFTARGGIFAFASASTSACAVAFALYFILEKTKTQ